MSPMRLIRNPLAVIAVLSAALALGGASAASAATHAAQTEPVNLYLYVGNGNLVPQVEPTQIYTADGTIVDEQGQAASGAIRRSRAEVPWLGLESLPDRRQPVLGQPQRDQGHTGRNRRGLGSAARTLHRQLLLQVPGVPAESARQQ